ncbi:MAG: F0F1 ATP synthase subunit A [Planctomycetes bacterium]|nr:F0F1 ATP synthase subunit A [Planctomycetota bacterium]
MRKATLFLACLVALICGTALPAQGHGHDGHAHEVRPITEMETGEFFTNNFVHLMPHQLSEGEVTFLTFYDVNLYQLIVLAILCLVFLPLAVNPNIGGWPYRVLRGWVHWLRDEVVYKTMGEEEGRRFAPFFVFLFFFILTMNMIGLVPHQVTSTATTMVTGALAVITFVMMVGGGILKQGVGSYFKHLLPSGLPAALIPLMALIELIGLFVKPIALTIRLFANMLAGHLLIYSFIGMIFVFAKLLDVSAMSWLPAIVTTVMAVFINIIESFVVVLQAYIFVFLSVMFVQESLHPAH